MLWAPARPPADKAARASDCYRGSRCRIVLEVSCRASGELDGVENRLEDPAEDRQRTVGKREAQVETLRAYPDVEFGALVGVDDATCRWVSAEHAGPDAVWTAFRFLSY